MRTSKDAPAAGAERKSLPPDSLDWPKLLTEAVTRPGVISQAYSRFWNYSTGNQLLAMMQCLLRGIEPGPIHTFRGWIDVGRHVTQGQKALTLCMPVTVKRKVDQEKLDSTSPRVGDGAERPVTKPAAVTVNPDGTVALTVFTYKPHWFVLSQTEGEEYMPTDIPQWTEANALYSLAIDRVRFVHSNGNCQGYALNREVAISPMAALPHKTLFHEMAHVMLGHTAEGHTLDDHERTPRNLREVEAESVALICCASLNLAGEAECRGYIQDWLGKEQIPDRSAQRIFKTADTILKAGRPISTEPESAI